MTKRIFFYLAIAWPFLLMFAGAAHAQSFCGGGGGPVAVTISPPLPDTWIITGKTVGQSIDGVTYSVTFNLNGCIPGSQFNGSGGQVSAALIGSPTGVPLYTTTGIQSGVAIKVPGTVAVSNPPLPAGAAGCGTKIGVTGLNGTGNVVTTAVICTKTGANLLAYNTTVTFSGVQFIVTDNTVAPSTLNYLNIGRTTTGTNVGLAYLVASTFTIINYNSGGNNILSGLNALPSIGGLACTQAVTIKNVRLPDVYVAQLTPANSTAGKTFFTVDLQSCGSGAAYIANAYWTFTPGASANRIVNNAVNPASNVEVQILGPTLSPITNNTNTTLGSVSSAGVYTPNTYIARYISSGPPGAGNVNAVANYLITYR